MIRGLFQILFLPVFIPLRYLYSNVLAVQNATILYAWYRNRKEYDEILRNSIDHGDFLQSKSWEEWLEGANAMCASCQEKGQPFVKVVVKP